MPPGTHLRLFTWPRFKMPRALRLEMGHSTTNMIFDHYRKLVTPQGGRGLLEHRPDNIRIHLTQHDQS